MNWATAEETIRQHYPMPSNVRRHASAANHDLYFGPMGPDHWRDEDDDDTLPDYTFSSSLQIFVDWIEDLDTVYIEEFSDCLVSGEPEGFWYNGETDHETCEEPEELEGYEWFDAESHIVVDTRTIADAFGYTELYNHK